MVTRMAWGGQGGDEWEEVSEARLDALHGRMAPHEREELKAASRRSYAVRSEVRRV